MTAQPKKIPVVGLLGGVASGKTTVARLFADLGCAVIEADAIAHQILEEPEVKASVVSRFGSSILTPDGKVNRAALGNIVFQAKEKLDFLNNLIHPRALARVRKAIADIRREGIAPAIIVDAPLLLEAGWDKECDVLVFVEANIDNRVRRATGRTGLHGKTLTDREKFQISLDTKARLAYYTINNNSDLEALAGQVGCVFSKILGAY